MRLTWAGQEFELLPERALYWIAGRSLILSDVHLGKAHDFQAAGIPIPAAVHDEDFARLSRVIRQWNPARVMILGDFVHSHDTELDDLIEKFKNMRGNCEWLLAIGNHDRRNVRKLERWGFDQIVDEVRESGIVFSHDPEDDADFAVSGHVHPVVKIGRSRDRLRLPCFVVSPERIILPSFGSFTGGFEVRPKKSARIFPVTEEKVYALDV